MTEAKLGETASKSEETREREPDVRAQIEAMLVEAGCKIGTPMFDKSDKGWYRLFVRGVRYSYSEDTDYQYEIPNEMAEIYTDNRVISDKIVYNEDIDRSYRITKRSLVGIYHLKLELKSLFPRIFDLLRTHFYSRFIWEENWLKVMAYQELEPEVAARLKQQIEPLPNGVVFFTQGEWVLVDGNDSAHKLGSAGQGAEACRYWLIYDPVKKRAAATHLDLLQDEEAVMEMVGHLIHTGSKKEDLQVRASSHAEPEAKAAIRKQFKSVRFDLNRSFIFDVSTGEQLNFDEETLEMKRQDHTLLKRIGRDFQTRIDNSIPHVLAYQSPTLITPP